MGGAREADKGRRLGGSSVGATRGALVPLLGSLKNLTIGLICLARGGGGEVWGGVGQGGGQGGEMGGGHQRAVWEQQGVHWFLFWAPLQT